LLFGTIKAQQPGDTIEVRSFNYSQTYGVNQWSPGIRDTMISFPTDPNVTYEKIIMLYNMRCKDNKVSNGSNRDQGCGEWDISCNTYIHDSTHIDSFLTSHPNYIISNFNGNTFDYVSSPTYNFYQNVQKLVTINSTVSETASVVGNGTLPLTEVLPTASIGAKSQYLFWHTEMNLAGVVPGNLDGISVKINGTTGPADFLRVRIKQTAKSVLDDSDPDMSGFTEVYYHNTPLVNGVNRLQFHTPFNWNGTDNIIVEFSFTNKAGNSSVDIEGDSITADYGLLSHNDAHFDFNSSNYIQLHNYKGVTGTGPRTVEAWIKTTTAGKEIVSWGQNSSGKKWVFRLDGSGKLRTEVNSGFIVGTTALTDGNWHHVAVSFGGGNINTAKLYVDGQLETISTSGSRIVNTGSSYNVRISRGIHNLYFEGNIANVRIWSDSLTQSTLQDWMYKDVNSAHMNYDSLSVSFPLNEGSGFSVNENTGKGVTGSVMNGGNWTWMRGIDHFKNLTLTNKRPNLTFYQGTYNQVVSNDTIIDTVQNNFHLVNEYQIFSNYAQIKHDSVGLVNSYSYYKADPQVLYDPTGNIVNSWQVTPDGTLNINDLPFYQRTPAKFEIMSFVTPYGLGLDMGVNGKTWTFDVTDYAPILKGQKRMTIERGGQWMEDMDIRFLFIVGTPPRDVLDISQIWRVDKPSYTNIQNDRFFEPRDIPLDANGKYFKIRSAVTGHGQEGEFIPRDHYIDIGGGSDEFVWKVWKTCGANPIYPQGGTWIYDRAGWCPGMATDVQEFDITPFVTAGQTANIDYGLYQASGSSNYIVNNQLVTYGDANFTLDAAIVDILSPSSKVEYERTSSVCENAEIIIRNTGSTQLTALTIEYWINNSTTPQTYTWTGSLDFMEETTVTLPRSTSIWDDLSGTGEDVFHVEIKNPNNSFDLYPHNNKLQTSFTLPDVLPANFYIWFKTNNASGENYYTIDDQYGNEIFRKQGFVNNTHYRDTFNLAPGCYVLKLYDTDGDGINFWANNDGAGVFQFRKLTLGAPLKVLQGDFGNFHIYNFTVNAPLSYEELNPAKELDVYPNPANNIFMVEMEGIGKADIQVVNSAGQVIELPKTVEDNIVTFDSSNLSEGVYYVRISTKEGTEVKKIVIL
jgi:hypothetical protein